MIIKLININMKDTFDNKKSDSFDLITDEEDVSNFINQENLPACSGQKIQKADEEYEFYFKSDLNSEKHINTNLTRR